MSADVGDGLKVKAKNVLNEQSRRTDKEWSYSLGDGRGTKTSSP
jgi:hypothetical protein